MEDATGAGPAAPPADSITPPPSYPAEWETDVVLTDGSTLRIRPILPDDGPGLLDFHARQSPQSIYYRYFSPRPRLSDKDVEHLTHVDYVDRMAFVGLRGDAIVGVSRYDRWHHRSEAEVAFFIDDEMHGRGMATVMLEHLAARAREVGISSFTASVLPENRKMLGVFTAAGFTSATRFADGVVEVRLDLQPTPDAEAAIEARAATAASRAVERLLRPRSIAVIGASREPGAIGHDVFRNLLRTGFQGPVWPVNPEAVHVASVRAVGSILDIPDEVDLAIVAVPAPAVPQVIEECGRKHVYGVVVLSAGFAEDGGEGVALEAEVLRLARRFGMRLLGPASLGLINTDPEVRLHGTSAAPRPLPGHVGLLSESGMIGVAIIDRARELGVGISSFVALGNRADVSGNDLLRYWARDDRTAVVCMYIESFGNPRHFSRIAKELSRRKPVVAVRAGREPGAAGPAGRPRDPSAAVLLEQTGVIRTRTLAQLLDVTRLLVHQPLPTGNRVAILGNAGGSHTIAADACLDAGLALATPSEPTRASIADLTRVAPPGNPVDLGLGAGASDFRRALTALLADDEVDAVLAVFAPSLGGTAEDVGAALGEASRSVPSKPVVGCFFGPRRLEVARSGDRTIPVYESVEPAAAALGKVAGYARWRSLDEGTAAMLEDDLVAAVRSHLTDGLTGSEPVPLPAPRMWSLLAQVGVPLAATVFAPDLDAALAAGEQLGWPVVLKARGRDRLAKTQAGGLALDLHDGQALAHAWSTMWERMGEQLVPAIVQRMEEPGIDVSVTAYVHPVVGPVLALKSGGAAGVLDPEVDLQVLPLTDSDAARFVAASHVAHVLDDGKRERLQELLLQVGALVECVPEIVDLSLDPVIVRPDGAVAVDASMRVAQVERDPVPPVRRLGGD